MIKKLLEIEKKNEALKKQFKKDMEYKLEELRQEELRKVEK